MKKTIAATILVVAAAALAAYLMRTRPPPPISTPRPGNAHREPGAPPAPPSTMAGTDLLDAQEIEIIRSRDGTALRDLAAKWRRAARQDAEFRRRLARIVRQSEADASVRELAAFVLGSLPDREGFEALCEALGASKDPAWTRLLLLALGCDRTSGDDDDIFGLPDSPRVFGTPLGLAVRIRGALGEEALRSRIVPLLRESGASGVRWAAALTLADSTGYPDVRRAFLDLLPAENDPATQGEVGKALAEWVAGDTAGAADRSEVFSALLDGARRPDAAALRLRSEDGMKRMAWSGAEVHAVSPLIASGTFDQRRWAISVLAGAAARPETPDRGSIFESLGRVAAAEPDAKVRELAVTGLSSFPDQSGTPTILISALGDQAWHVRAAAVRALGRMGSTEEILAAVRRSEAGDSDDRVRRAAAEVRQSLSSK